MPGWAVLLLFSLIVLASHFLEGITGFGSTALSIPFLSVLIGIEVAKPVLMCYTLLLCAYILPKNIRIVEWRTYGRMMAVLLLGLPVGVLLYNRLPQALLLGLLAVFMIAVAVRGLLYAFGAVKAGKPLKELPGLALVFLGGIFHGAFSSGGPLIIIYATEKIKDKSAFRATMCMVWLAMNVLLLTQMAFAGQLGADVWKTALWGLPALVAGTVLGDWAHHRIRDTVFTKLTYGILLLSGVFMVANLL